MKKDLPRDTPVETPAIIEAPELGPEATELGAHALARVELETLEGAYAAWAELLAAHRSARRRWDEERVRLEEQGALLLGAVRAAGGATSTPVEGASSGEQGLVKAGELDQFLAQAKQKLEASKAELAERTRVADEAFTSELGKLRGGILARVSRQAAQVRPAFRLAVRNLGGERRILHARRLGEDEAVIALFVLTGRIPSRYHYLLDDATDDVLAAPPSLYADEGNTELRPTATALSAQLDARQDVWPVKGSLPLKLPDGRWMRWCSRGAVLEAEIADGDAFRNLLTRDEAERITGALLAQKLAGRLELELVRD
ncbi:MAG: hypothetical protein ACOZQL_27110 [Myxococcota bacterium]